MLSKNPNRELAAFYRKLGHEFDSFARRGTSLVQAPVQQFLFGFSFNPKSGQRECRWLQPFGFPLYVPNEFVRLSYGERIPRNPRPGIDALWVYVYDSHLEPELDAEKVMRDLGLPMLERFQTVDAFATFLESYPAHMRDSTYFLDKAATSALQGNLETAAMEIAAHRKNLEDWRVSVGLPVLRDYQLQELKIAAIIERLANANDHEGMQRQLWQWREENLDRLGIRDIAVPPGHRRRQGLSGCGRL